MSIDKSLNISHPPLQNDWIDAPHHLLNIGDLPLELGGCIQNCQISYTTHGDITEHTKPLVIFLCAIGSIHHRLDFLLNQSKTLSLHNTRVIAIDALGNGLSSSPSNSREQPFFQFPKFGMAFQHSIENWLRILKNRSPAPDTLGEVLIVLAKVAGLELVGHGFPKKTGALRPRGKSGGREAGDFVYCGGWVLEAGLLDNGKAHHLPLKG